VYYNMHEVDDPTTGKKRTVFINTSIPMHTIARREKDAEKNLTLDIRKQ